MNRTYETLRMLSVGLGGRRGAVAGEIVGPRLVVLLAPSPRVTDGDAIPRLPGDVVDAGDLTTGRACDNPDLGEGLVAEFTERMVAESFCPTDSDVVALGVRNT